MDLEDPRNLEMQEIFSSDEEVENIRRAPKRYFRDYQNPFEFYNDTEFKKRFRFSKNSIMFGIVPLIEQGLAKINNRGLPISPVIQLLICLRFYSTASFQLVLGDIITISQPTISRIVLRVSLLLASYINKYIKMPSSEESYYENKRLFKELGRGNGGIGFPSIDGALDCTHIRLVNTQLLNIDEMFRNRKGYFSLNVQIIVGPRTEILDIVPEWPGSQHDSRILQNSRIFMRYTQGQLDGFLVGDGGYPALPFLLTPISDPTTDEETSYNIIHKRTRIIIERTIGIWKRRFPCLSKGLTTKLSTSTIVVACAVLHNLSLIFNDKLDDDDEEVEDINNEVPEIQPHWQPGDGFLVRNALIERLFR